MKLKTLAMKNCTQNQVSDQPTNSNKGGVADPVLAKFGSSANDDISSKYY